MALQSEDLLRPQDLKSCGYEFDYRWRHNFSDKQDLWYPWDYREHNHVIYFGYMKENDCFCCVWTIRTGNTMTLFDLMTDDLLFSENAQALMLQLVVRQVRVNIIILIMPFYKFERMG